MMGVLLRLDSTALLLPVPLRIGRTGMMGVLFRMDSTAMLLPVPLWIGRTGMMGDAPPVGQHSYASAGSFADWLNCLRDFPFMGNPSKTLCGLWAAPLSVLLLLWSACRDVPPAGRASAALHPVRTFGP